jgi:GntR family transcriptional regulator / MocR family aminotransferase
LLARPFPGEHNAAVSARTPRKSPFILKLDRKSGIALQSQIRQQVVEGIFAGQFRPGQRLPSSRKLAQQLKVARNTVLLAYQELIADGHIVSRSRSGLYLNASLLKQQGSLVGPGATLRAPPAQDWSRHLLARPQDFFAPSRPEDWQNYPYPFVDGCFDQSLFPRDEWRDALRLALSRRQIDEWSVDHGDADDALLIEQIRTRILPRRGIAASADEILVTAGTEPALHLLTELLVQAGTRVGVEEPGHIAMRELLRRRGAHILPQPVDDEGMAVGESLERCQLVYVSPSHQRPTAVTLSVERRQALLQRMARIDGLIIEDDVDSATNYLEDAPAALRAMAGGERVIYVADFSAVLAPAVRLGFMVAAPQIIAVARRLRALIARHPPMSIQRTMALLLSSGHYDVAMLRLGRIFRERLFALREALNHYLQGFIAIAPARGGTTYWVRGPQGIDARDLAREAATRGILIEPVADYYLIANPQRHLFRLGITALPVERVRAGVQALALVVRDIAARQAPTDGDSGWLQSAELQRALQGASIQCKTVYGHPCTIELLPDGRMRGRAGYAAEDCDEGRWWVEGERWFRQWHSWAYGEITSFHVRIQDGHIQWFNDKRQLVDAADFIPAGEGAVA